MRVFLYAAVIMSLLGFGCAQKKVVAQPETQQASAEKAAETAKKTEKVTEPVSEQKAAQVESTNLPTPAKVEEIATAFQDIHFDFDKYNIRDDAKPALKSVSDYFIKNNSQKLLIEGHCDERGTSEYNLALGDRRAKSTMGYLVSSGISSSRMEIVSYGKEKPLCNEHNEECWARNRRSHFVVLKAQK